MRAMRCAGEGKVELVEMPRPEPREGEVLIKIEASAVCGSERATLIRGTATAQAASPNDGHEACGLVVVPGSSGFSVGERVGLSAVAGCGKCKRCAAGQEIHCTRGWTYSASSGWHAEFAALPASCLLRLPAGMDAGLGAMVIGDTLGVAARAFRREPTGEGDIVVVFGLGPVGLGHIAVRAFTGATVVAVEPSAYRRNLAVSLGAKAAVPPGSALDVRPRLVLECSGRPDCIAEAIELVEPGGSVRQSGLCHQPVTIDPMTFWEREITYTGDMYFAHEDYPTMLELFKSGVPLQEICTHDVQAADAQDAIKDFLDGRSGKVILRWA